MKTLQKLLIVSLLLIICSGIYGVVIGIHYTNEYLSLTEELREQAGVALTTGELIFNYFSGVFRGIATLAFGIAGLINIRKRNMKTWYWVLGGVFALLYVLGWIRFSDTEELVQMLAAVFCFVLLSICRGRNSNGNFFRKGEKNETV